MADPPQAQLVDALHARYGPRHRARPLDQLRIHRVHEPVVDAARRVLQHEHDRNRDQEADDRIGSLEPERNAAPSNTPSEVSPSVRACKPSATSAAEPIRRPVRIRYWAATSLPRNPATAATATQPTFSTSCGCTRRSTASYPVTAAD